MLDRVAFFLARPARGALFAIGIEEVGYVTGRNLAQHFRTVDALLAATPEEIEQTLARHTSADQQVYANTLAEFGERVAFLGESTQHRYPDPGDVLGRPDGEREA